MYPSNKGYAFSCAIASPLSTEKPAARGRISTGFVIKLIPIPEDPVAALRDCSKGEGLSASLLRDSKEDAKREKGSLSA